VPENAGIEPRIVLTLALTVTRSYRSAKTQPQTKTLKQRMEMKRHMVLLAEETYIVAKYQVVNLEGRGFCTNAFFANLSKSLSFLFNC
jgi:hypothetical protein